MSIAFSGQKFHLYVRSAFDPFIFAEVGIQAGISQAKNSFSFPEYGQGAASFGNRCGAAVGDSTSSGFVHKGAKPASTPVP